MIASKQHADEVLQSFRKRRPTPACYPCSKRKVRCKGGRPCGSCIARGHPEICHDGDHRQRRKSAGASPVSGHENLSKTATTASELDEQTQQPSSASGSLTEHPEPTRASSPSDPRVGRFSAMTFIRERLSGAHKVPNGDIHPSMGLGNSDHELPSLGPSGAASQGSLLPPRREEVLQYYPPFRDCIMPLYNVVFDVVVFESTMYEVLKNSVRAENQQVAVVLATLALGAQFAEVAQKSRRQTSLELIYRANAYLQQANYIFRPTLEAVQALLIIGIALQNVGQPDGAWNLLGLNYRLAQTLGLHLLDPDEGGGATLWNTIIHQDALLSCRYDRSPLSHTTSIKDLRGRYDLSYFPAMKGLCALEIDVLQQPQSHRLDKNYVSGTVQELDDLLARCCAHLQSGERPRTFQQRLEQRALQLHSSLFLADLCRSMFSVADVYADETHRELRRRGFNALMANIEAFLEICSFSNIPLRLWSMTQATVSCALVLAVIHSRTTHSTVAALLRRLVAALKKDTGAHDPAVTCSIGDLHGVCLMRIKGASLVESILDNQDDTSSGLPREHGNEQHSSVTDNNVTPCYDDGLPSAEDLAWPAELPMFDRGFTDSILDFDVDQSWYENITGVIEK